MKKEELLTLTSESAESQHYKGVSGVKYFNWQNRNAQITAKIEARKFQTHIRSEDVVLDFGCGGGHLLRSLYCARGIGVEINPAARSAAIQLGIECYDSLASIEDNSIDVVISNHVLEHVPCPVSALRSLLKALKPSGLMLLCVPIDDWRTQLKYDPHDINHHLHTWTPQLLGNSLCEAGFIESQFSIKIMTHAWFPGTARIYGAMPNSIFDMLCTLSAVVTKRRQLFVIAKKD